MKQFGHIYRIALLLLLTSAGSAAAGPDASVVITGDSTSQSIPMRKKRYLHDAEQKLTAEEVLQRFTTTAVNDKIADDGYGYWVAVQLKNSSSRSAWLITYPVPIARGMRAYWSANGQLKKLGSSPPPERTLASLHSVPLDLREGEEGVLLLHIQNELFAKPPLYITTAEVFSRWESLSVVVSMVCFGVILANLIVSLFTLAALRTGSVLIYTLYLVAHLAFILSIGGYLMNVMPTDLSLKISSSSVFTLAMAFLISFLRPAKIGWIGKTILFTVCAINFSYFIGYVFGSDLLHNVARYRVVSVLTLVLLIVTCAVYGHRYRLAYLVGLGWLALFCSHIPVVLANADILDIPLRGMLLSVGNTLEMLIISVSIGISIIQLRRDKTAAVTASEVSREAVKRKTEFVDTISHEIRTPLHGLLGTIDKVRDKNIDPTVADYVDQLHSAGEALHGLTDNLLHYNLSDTTPSTFNPRQIANAVRQLFSQRAEEKGISIVVDSNDYTTNGSREAYRRILINLVSNAIKYTAGGEITIRTACEDGELRCYVKDSGQGLPTKLVQQLNSNQTVSQEEFETHYSESPSSGLGLHITQSLVHQSGGFITFTNHDDGLEVVFTQPVTDVIETPAVTALSLHVLVIDDLLTNREIANAQLQQLGCKTTLASSSAEAFDHLENDTSIDVVLIDHYLDDEDGLVLCQKLRESQDARLAKLNIIVMTAHGGQAVLETIADLHCQFLRKPFTRDQLKQSLEATQQP